MRGLGPSASLHNDVLDVGKRENADPGVLPLDDDARHIGAENDSVVVSVALGKGDYFAVGHGDGKSSSAIIERTAGSHFFVHRDPP